MKKEFVYNVDDYWDMTIISGVANYNGTPHYFECQYSENKDDYGLSDKYSLKGLNENIFNLTQTNWFYWIKWLSLNDGTPHPYEYKKLRQYQSVKDISMLSLFPTEKLEEYYQNELIIENYLSSKKGFIMRGIFEGKLDGSNTLVEWHTI